MSILYVYVYIVFFCADFNEFHYPKKYCTSLLQFLFRPDIQTKYYWFITPKSKWEKHNCIFSGSFLHFGGLLTPTLKKPPPPPPTHTHTHQFLLTSLIYSGSQKKKNRTLKQWNAGEQVLGCMTIIIFHEVWLLCFRMIHCWNSSGHALLSSIVFNIECQNPFVPLYGRQVNGYYHNPMWPSFIG